MDKIHIKKCSVCKEEKSIEDFYSNRAKVCGTESACIVCFKKKTKTYYSKDYIPAITQAQIAEERWDSVIIDDNKYPYKVSDCGRVVSVGSGKILKPSLDQRGYPQVVVYLNAKPKTRRVHVLVAKIFVDNPGNLPEVNHKDGNKFNPHYTNLEWNTSKQNKDHSVKMGLWKPNEFNGKSRKVVDSVTGRVYFSVRDASNNTGIDYYKLWNCLIGNTRNKTTLKYL